MQGTVKECNLSPTSTNYNYQGMLTDLQNKYGFENLGEGAFGSVLGNNICAIKVIKDVKRCAELSKEKEIYSIIEEHRDKLDTIKGKIPHFILFEELQDFCHFNMDRIYPPLSGYGDIYEDEDHGYGYVLNSQDDRYLLNDIENGQQIWIDQRKVYSIDRPGSLIHFYVNYYDPNLKEKLDKNQGILMGKNQLERNFGNLAGFTHQIGQLLSFLVFVCHVAPFDVEVVIGSKGKNDRTLAPYFYDFNESEIIPKFSNLDTLYTYVAKSMFSKNGKFYFPNKNNPYYEHFRMGFAYFASPQNPGEVDEILNRYNAMFQ